MNEIIRLYKNIKKVNDNKILEIIFKNLAEDFGDTDVSLSFFNETLEYEIEYQSSGFDGTE